MEITKISVSAALSPEVKCLSGMILLRSTSSGSPPVRLNFRGLVTGIKPYVPSGDVDISTTYNRYSGHKSMFNHGGPTYLATMPTMASLHPLEGFAQIPGTAQMQRFCNHQLKKSAFDFECHDAIP